MTSEPESEIDKRRSSAGEVVPSIAHGEPAEQPSPALPQSALKKRRWRVAAVAAAAAVLLASVATGVSFWRYDRPGRRFARAVAALEAKRLDEVAQALAQLEKHPGFEAHCSFLRGALLLRRGQLYPALNQFEHSVKHPELRVLTLVLSGEALYRTGDLRNAIWVLHQAVEAAPEAVGAERWLASAYYDLGLMNHAADHLRRIAELDPADPRPHRLLGLIYTDFRRYDLAVECYRESLRRDQRQPDRDAILIELASCHLKRGEFDAALAALADCKPSPDRWAAEAECCAGAGRTDEALRLLGQALGHSPAHLPSLLLKGTILLTQGKPAEAVEVLSRAAAAFPKDYAVQSRLARAYLALGKKDLAQQHEQAADQIQRLYREFTALHQTAANESANVEVRYRLGLIARQLGRPDLARVWFRAAVGIDPAHAGARRELLGEAPTQPAKPAPK